MSFLSTGRTLAILRRVAAIAATTAPCAAWADDCAQVADAVQFCFAPGAWVAVDDLQTDTVASYRDPAQVLAQFFVEKDGPKSGQTLDSIVQTFVSETEATLPLDDPALVEPARVAGLQGRTVVYAVTDGDVTDVIHATIVVTSAQTLRFATIEQESRDAASPAATHARFLAQIRIL